MPDPFIQRTLLCLALLSLPLTRVTRDDGGWHALGFFPKGQNLLNAALNWFSLLFTYSVDVLFGISFKSFAFSLVLLYQFPMLEMHERHQTQSLSISVSSHIYHAILP